MDNTNLNQSGIYTITSPSGKRYVGQAKHIAQRWRQHQR
ncbi:GIY-YIG nuclease family protein, partial [Xanthomonas citri pv. citri]|nr:GIY-YIG nuclease family protein [Xanthomonas citri pv. citri]